jgi:transcriptional regulator with XRE-family HTH domain
MESVEFAPMLRDRRARLRLSQLELSLRAGTTQRHLSFIESGRSVPGREMIIRLAEALGLPLRERNQLLLAAGYAPVYSEHPLDSTAIAAAREALDHILVAHLPYPAIIVDRYGDLVAANAARQILLDGCAPELLAPPANAFRLALHPDGMAPRIVNFAEWARHVLNGIAAELARNPDDRLAGLLAELTGYVPATRPGPGHLGFAVPLQFLTDDGELRLITTITSFATAVDVTLSELKLEAFLPADAQTAEILLAGNHPAMPTARQMPATPSRQAAQARHCR